MYLKNHATQNTCDLELSNQFSSFFKSKIELIREKIDDGDSANFDAGISPATQDTFNSFEIAAVHEVQTLIDAMPNKTCVLDPLLVGERMFPRNCPLFYQNYKCFTHIWHFSFRTKICNCETSS